MNISKFKTQILVLVLLCSNLALASGRVLQVNRLLSEKNDGELPAKTYYVGIGTQSGISVGDVVEVYREEPVVNGTTGEVEEFFIAQVGQLRITQAGTRTSMAQAVESRNPDSVPQLDYPVILIGDKVKLKLFD